MNVRRDDSAHPEIAMRSPLDRVRHAISFEVIGLVLIIPLGAVAFHMPIHDIGVVGLASATLATLWNFLYNYLFDVAMQRAAGTTEKRGRVRVLHAILFEAGLLVVLLPFIAWYLGISLWQAFVMDLSFALFYMGYASYSRYPNGAKTRSGRKNGVTAPSTGWPINCHPVGSCLTVLNGFTTAAHQVYPLVPVGAEVATTRPTTWRTEGSPPFRQLTGSWAPPSRLHNARATREAQP